MTIRLEERSPNDLTNHTLNVKLYGDEKPPQDFIDSIQQDGVLQPLVILPDNTVIVGHRRKNAARIVGLKSVPVLVRDDLRDPLQIERLLIVSNKNRPKTNEQMAREAARLAEIEAELASAREKAGKSSTKPDPSVKSREGRTDAKVAVELGVGESKARDLIAAGKALEEAETKGHTRKAERIKEALEQSPRAGAKAAKPTPRSDTTSIADKLTGNAERLLTKLAGDFNRAVDALGPLVNVYDEIKAADDSFARKHKELLGHHSRMFSACEEGRRALKALQAAWTRK